MDPIERAKLRVANYLTTFEPQPGIQDAVDLLIDSRDAKALLYVTEYASVKPEEMPLERLWDLVDAGDRVEPEAQAQALAAITNVLLTAWEDLDFDYPLVDDVPIMTQAEIDAHVARLLSTYRSPVHDKLVRRRALEFAANVSNDESIVSAGHAAFRTDDADWVRTGILVVTLTDPEQAGDLIDEALKHDDVRVRCEAIQALGHLERVDDIDLLATFAGSGNELESKAAFETLSSMALEQAGEELFRLSEEAPGPIAERAREAWDIWFEELGALAEGFDEDFDEDFDLALADDLDDDDLDDDEPT